jgi:hypothetical protein
MSAAIKSNPECIASEIMLIEFIARPTPSLPSVSILLEAIESKAAFILGLNVFTFFFFKNYNTS